MDFNHPLHHELLIKPGEETAEISVNITEDDLHESNETFLLTLMSLDKVTTITGGSTTITILNNGKSYGYDDDGEVLKKYFLCSQCS